jgi:hypothetical protein
LAAAQAAAESSSWTRCLQLSGTSLIPQAVLDRDESSVTFLRSRKLHPLSLLFERCAFSHARFAQEAERRNIGERFELLDLGSSG